MDEIPQQQPLPAARTVFRSALAALILLALTALLLWGAAWGYFQRHSLAICMAGSFLATLTLAMTMRALDRPLVRCTLPFYARLPLQLNKRIILVVQLVTMTIAVGMAFVMAFHFKLPGM